MAAHAVEVHPERVHVDGDLAKRLHAIHVQRHASLARDAGDLGDGLHGAQFVIGVHDGDQHGLRAQRAPHVLGIHDAAGADRQTRDGNTFALQLGRGREHGGMLDGAGNQVGLRASRRADHAHDGQVVGLRTAARENHFRGARVDQRRHLPAGGFQFLFGGLAEMMDAGSVTIHLTETRHRRLQNFGSDGGGSVVVEIEMLHVELFYQCRRPSLP